MLIFLYGPDSFRSLQKLLEIKEKFLKGNSASSGLSIFDYEESIRAGQLLATLGTPNLLAPKRLVIVKKIIASGSAEEQKEVLGYLKKNTKKIAEDKDLVALFWEEDTPKKNNALFKFFDSKESGVSKQSFAELSGAKLNQWTLARIKEMDIQASISHPALDKLLAYAGDDRYVLDSEIKKLVSFSAGKSIEEKDVDLLVRVNLDGNIFNTIDALANNNKKEAAKLLHRHLEQGEDPFYIFSMFIYQFRNLLKVADLKENFGFGEVEISRRAKLHPFVVRKCLGQIRNFSLAGQAFARLKDIYRELAELDLKIKTGQIDIEVALDKIWAEL